jgi:hypothetical protein
LIPLIGLETTVQTLSLPLNSSSQVVASFPDYHRQVSVAITQTSKRALQGYLAWKAIYTLQAAIGTGALPAVAALKNQMNGLVSLVVTLHPYAC